MAFIQRDAPANERRVIRARKSSSVLVPVYNIRNCLVHQSILPMLVRNSAIYCTSTVYMQ